MFKKFKIHSKNIDYVCGDYRVVFEWLDHEIYIDVTEADNRGDVYKKY